MVKGPTIFGVEELRWLARSVVSAQDRVRHPATPSGRVKRIYHASLIS